MIPLVLSVTHPTQYYICPPKRGDKHFSGLHYKDKKAMFEKIGRSFKEDGFIPFIVSTELYYDKDLYREESVELLNELISVYDDERFEEEINTFNKYYKSKGEKLYR